MASRNVTGCGEKVFEVDPWLVKDSSIPREGSENYHAAAVFTIANGKFGLRGDGVAFINGFYEQQEIVYPEPAYGYAKDNQIMLMVPNCMSFQLFAGNEKFVLEQSNVSGYQRTLDLRSMILTTQYQWNLESGAAILVTETRFVSLKDQSLGLANFKLKSLGFAGQVRVESFIDTEIVNTAAGDDPRVGSSIGDQALQVQKIYQDKEFQDKNFTGVELATKISKKHLFCSITNRVPAGCSGFDVEKYQEGKRVGDRFILKLDNNGEFEITKYAQYHTRDENEAELLFDEAHKGELEAAMTSFADQTKRQSEEMAKFWRHADCSIGNCDELTQALRFAVAQVFCSAGRDGKTNIASKGLTGEGYGGHYFWDTEMYMSYPIGFQFPEILRSLLEYRYSILQAARDRARELHLAGALYTWRTISGPETSAYFPAGTAQVHINGAICFSIAFYQAITGDKDFLLHMGAEVIFEMARAWYSLGYYSPTKGNKFCFNEVTGPDEYSALVNNDFYTNLMGKFNLEYAVTISKELADQNLEGFLALKKKINLQDSEVQDWEKAAKNVYFSYDKEKGIYPQDDTFLDLKPWDFEGTPADRHPLLMHYHYLSIYRHQVLKQPDVILGQFWFGNKFSLEQKMRDFKFYEPLTTHDSSLSMCIHSIMACELGLLEKSYEYFLMTARLDLDNVHQNTFDGLHMANLAGTWMGLTYGFGGMRIYDGSLRFSPAIPASWSDYRFRILFKGALLEVYVRPDEVSYQLLEGELILFQHRDEEVVSLTKELSSRSFPLTK